MLKKALFTLTLLCIITSLFIKIDTIISHRFMMAIWPFCHVIAFALPSFLLLSYCTKMKLNLDDISSLGLYINKPKSTISLYLGSMYLE